MGGETLTEREREVLACSASGQTAKEIAQALFVSPNTVKNHLQHIFHKLDVRGGGAGRAAVAVARARGLLP